MGLAVEATSVAARTATEVCTDKVKIDFTVWTADPAVGWDNENEAIAETGGTTDEVEVIQTKTAGVNPISTELADNSTPAALDFIAAGLSNQITSRHRRGVPG